MVTTRVMFWHSGRVLDSGRQNHEFTPPVSASLFDVFLFCCTAVILYTHGGWWADCWWVDGTTPALLKNLHCTAVVLYLHGG